MSDKTEFEKAFAAARKAGKKQFTYKGKKYHTRTKDDLKKIVTTPPNKSENKEGEGEGMYQRGSKIKSKKYDHEAEKKRLLKKGKRRGTFFGFHKKGGFRNSESWIESPNFDLDD